MSASGVSRFVTAPDGLRLHVREYGERGSQHLPVVCLPGLSRTAEDFEAMKTRHPGIDVVVAPDQGHAPLLAEPDIIARIKQFAEKCDAVHVAVA
jgi:pimeloyl-ACP methyl ester carboxylesterase